MKKSLLIATIIALPMAAQAFYLDSSDLNPILNIGNGATQQNKPVVSIPTVDLNKTITTQTVGINPLSVLNNLNNKMTTTDTNVQNSFLNLVSILSSKQESQTMQSKINSILSNQAATSYSKSSAVSQLMTAYASDLVKNKSNLASTIMSMNASDKSNLVKAISSLAQSQTDYLNLANEYTKAAATITKTSQSMAEVANNLRTIQETANTLKTNAQALQSLITQVSSIAKTGGLNLAN